VYARRRRMDTLDTTRESVWVGTFLKSTWASGLKTKGRCSACICTMLLTKRSRLCSPWAVYCRTSIVGARAKIFSWASYNSCCIVRRPNVDVFIAQWLAEVVVIVKGTTLTNSYQKRNSILWRCYYVHCVDAADRFYGRQNASQRERP